MHQEDPIAAALANVRLTKEKELKALDDLALAVLQARDEGATVRSLAERHHVNQSAIQTWTNRGRALREGRHPQRHTRARDGAPAAVLPIAAQWALVVAIAISLIVNVADLLLLIWEHGGL